MFGVGFVYCNTVNVEHCMLIEVYFMYIILTKVVGCMTLLLCIRDLGAVGWVFHAFSLYN